MRVLQEARAALPFGDESDFQEWGRGFIAAPPELQIMAEAGKAAVDKAQFMFLDQEAPFDSVHPSLQRIARLEIMPGTKLHTERASQEPFEGDISVPIPE